MSIQQHLSQWCQTRGLSLADLSQQTGVDLAKLQDFQKGNWDPPLSTMALIAESLNVPESWLHHDPRTLLRLWNESDEDIPELPSTSSPDPLFQRIIQTSRDHQDLFVLLTSLLHHGDPKLIRAAQVSLQSLFKQVRPTTVPWGSRPPGHFEPPND